MALIEQTSAFATKNELNLFSVPPTEVAVKESFWTEIHPLNTITSAGPWEFRLPADVHYIDLSRNYIWMQLKITRPGGEVLRWDEPAGAAAVHPEDKTAPIQLIGKTFFQQVKLFLNSTLVYDSHDTYAYRAYLETELNYSEEVKQSYLRVAGYKKDGDTPNAADNEGFRRRAIWFKDSETVELMANLHIDLFCQQRYLVNNIEMYLQLFRNSDPFLLMNFANNPNLKLELQDIRFNIMKIDPAESLCMGLERTLQMAPLNYPIRRCQIRVQHIEEGRRDTPNTVLFTGQLPRRIFIGFVRNAAYFGDYSMSPFNFEHFHIQSVQVTSGGKNFPPNPIEMNFRQRKYAKPLIYMYEALGLPAAARSNGIGFSEYRNGSCFFVFNLTSDGQEDGTWELLKQGATTARVKFADAVPAGGAKLICMAEYDNLLKIDKHRNVFSDYVA